MARTPECRGGCPFFSRVVEVTRKVTEANDTRLLFQSLLDDMGKEKLRLNAALQTLLNNRPPQ